MVWPTAGGSYTDGSVWYLVDGNTTLEGLNAELAKIQLAVEEGDTLSFVAKRKGTEWYDFGVMPSVTVASASLRGTVDALSSNLPTNTGTSVTYQGNWKFGYFAKDSTTFNTYTYYDTRNGWITSGEDEIWGKNGGIYAKNNYLYGTTNNGVRVAIAYTVPKDGKIALTLGSFVNSIGEGITGYYGVFLDGKAVCGEGSITGDTSSAAWTAVNSSTTRREISADMRAAGTIEVKKGQTIYFVATFGAVNWAQFAALPNVIYLT